MPTLLNVRAEEIIIVDDDRGEALRLRALQVELLPADIPLIARRARVGRAVVTLGAPRNGDGKSHVEKDRIVPVFPKLRPVEKYAVEDQDVSGRGVGRRLNRAIGSVIEHGDAVSPAASRAHGIEQLGLQLLVVVRVMEEPLRRVPASPVSDHPGIVEAVDRGADDGSPQGLQHIRQLIGEAGLARAVHAVDGDP